MSLQRSKLRMIESATGSGIDAILESVTALRAKVRHESAADPGYGFGQQGKSAAPAAGAKPKFSKKPKA